MTSAAAALTRATLTRVAPKQYYDFIFRCQSHNHNHHQFRLLQSSTTPKQSKSTTRKPISVYLIQKLGFSEEQSLSISNKLLRRRDVNTTRDYQVTDLISFEKSDTVITYLQQHCGLNLSHIKKAVTKHPPILGSNVDKTLKPKIKLLQDLGFSTSELARVLSTNPFLYLHCDLCPAIQALRGIMGSDDKAVVRALKGLKRDTGPTITKNLIPNVTMMENEYGIPRDKIRKFVAKVPNIMIARTEWVREVLVRVEQKWGISRDSAQFLTALHVFGGLTDEKINSKFQVLRSYGCSDSDILTLIRKNPYCLANSEAKIKKKLDFYMNEAGCDLAYLVSRPGLLCFSIENRVMPRLRVMSILKESGLMKTEYQLASYLSFSNEHFFDTFILPYDNGVLKLRQVYGVPNEA